MKKQLRYIIYLAVNFRTFLFVNYYKIKNRNRKKIFIYTDSRGFEITKVFNRKSPFSSYLLYFIKKFNCDVYICPEKHTTITDFLYKLSKKKQNEYDFIIAHIGVVDFSPRPISMVKKILSLKKNKIINVFGEEIYEKMKSLEIYKEEYLGEKTSPIISNQLLETIAFKFNIIPRFIWISCNPVDVTWRGNYKKERPKNINIVNEKSEKLITLLSKDINVVDLTKLSLTNVRKYTCDNIHLSKEGMIYIEEELKKIIKNETENKSNN